MRSEYDVYSMPGIERSAEEMLANKLWFSTGGSFDLRGCSATSRDILVVTTEELLLASSG